MPGRSPSPCRSGLQNRCHGAGFASQNEGRERGAVLVEFAFAFPVLLLVVVFALALLWAAFVQVAAGHAAREGARYASVAQRPTYRTHPDASAVVDRVRNRVGVLGLEASDVSVEYPGCATSCSNGPVVVTVRKTIPGPLRPFVGVFTGGDTIVARSEGKVRAE